MDSNKKTIISQALEKGISYNQYVLLVKDLVAEKSTTGEEKTEALINYTLLNDRRLKRWNKTLKVSENQIERLSNHSKKITWLVLTESWCGDAAHVMPAINKVVELNDAIDLKVVLRDENIELMDAFLTNGNQSIPKLIMIDSESEEVLNSYGPRPSDATKLVDDYKKKHGKLTPEFKEDLQKWYNKDKGQNTVIDLLNLLDL
ncbi:MAG: thioredoxin family protein [Lutibacter sp.]|nr:MAG: thioredoxin family protein [Lutibacter sp.]